MSYTHARKWEGISRLHVGSIAPPVSQGHQNYNLQKYVILAIQKPDLETKKETDGFIRMVLVHTNMNCATQVNRMRGLYGA